MTDHTPHATSAPGESIAGLRVLDTSFARLMVRLNGSDSPALHLAAALTSFAATKGHICFDLNAPHAALPRQSIDSPPPFPAPDTWHAALAQSAVVGAPGERAPLILDGDRLYLHRHWADEKLIADTIDAYGTRDSLPIEPAAARAAIERMLPAKYHDTQQRIAACVAAMRPLCVITGGPGTGKTTTVALVLAVLLELDPALRIALAAPTGKAAARMQEALRLAANERLAASPALVERFPQEAMTIHRLLGARGAGHGFVHTGDNPLGIDLLVLDEASMIDLPLMARLFEALPRTCRLIILGDRNQLSSVEAGAVLGDLCAPAAMRRFSAETAAAIAQLSDEKVPVEESGTQRPSAADSLVELTVVHRFSRSLGMVSRALCDGDVAETEAGIAASPEVEWYQHPISGHAPAAAIEQRIVTGFERYLQAQSVAERFEALNDFRILCALRHGPSGVEAMNLLVERTLARRGLLSPTTTFYTGRPLLITRNDYALELFNGDIGFVTETPEGPRVVFETPSKQYRFVSPHRLTACETAFAVTVHKSQGTELKHIMLVLPEHDAPVLSRELVYTGLTRARHSACIVSPREILSTTILRRTRRRSGLALRLWGETHAQRS